MSIVILDLGTDAANNLTTSPQAGPTFALSARNGTYVPIFVKLVFAPLTNITVTIEAQGFDYTTWAPFGTIKQGNFVSPNSTTTAIQTFASTDGAHSEWLFVPPTSADLIWRCQAWCSGITVSTQRVTIYANAVLSPSVSP